MTPTELLEIIRTVAPAAPPAFALGTVDEAYTSGLPTVRFDDETTASTRGRPHLDGYTPTAADRVLLGRAGGGWVILGRVVA